LRKSLLNLLDHLHHIETLVVPMETDGNDPRGLLLDVFENGKMMIFNPLHSHVHNLGRNALTLEEVG
jgi:hypothetical protein